MTREEAIHKLAFMQQYYTWRDGEIEAFEMAIEALKAQEYDEIVFDMKEFFSIVDDGKITVMRRGRGRVTVEHPAIQMETTICSYGYGEGSEE